ncbi:MAG: GNAT family N-acetyltransferase [Anaerolineaceae bacterium]|nr:GNAT family N-acetyltransferase [Anaerolineaceae bacterium]
MKYQLLRSAEEMNQIAREWNALLDESTSHVPFLRHEYLRTWWQTRGGGEWKDGELAVVIAREGERLVGIAPLFFTPNREGIPALMLLGSIEISDYLDVIVREVDLTAFIEGLLPFLRALDSPAWQVLDWYNLLDSSPTLAVLEKTAVQQGWGYQQELLQHSPFIPLPGNWDAYLASLDKKQRHEIRRKMRRVESGEKPARWYVVADSNTLEAEGKAFIELMAQDPEKAAFLTPAMREQMQLVIRCAFDEGCLLLSFLEIGGEKAAAYLGLDYLNRIWMYNSGLDRRFNEYSPGWVLLADLLRWANENGREEFDFMRGDEDYKYRFGAIDRFIVRVRVHYDPETMGMKEI